MWIELFHLFMRDQRFIPIHCCVSGNRHLLNFGIDFKTAIKSCTINPARAIGEDKKIGSISVGKCADLIVTDENFNIEEVYINGTLA